MAKLGKYSTGINTKAPKSAPFVNSNGGYEKRQSLTAEMGRSAPMNLERHTATGNKTLVKK